MDPAKGGWGAEICPYQRQKEEQIKPKTRVRSLKLVRKKNYFTKAEIMLKMIMRKKNMQKR